MAWTQKLKDWIDWARRIQFVVSILVGFLGVGAMRLLLFYRQIPSVWHLFLYSLAGLIAVLALQPLFEKMENRRQRAKLENQRTIRDIKATAAKGAVLAFLEDRATSLQAQLERLWHHWNNAGERLVHPLNSKLDNFVNPSANAASLSDERRDFMVLYSAHLMNIKAEFPDIETLAIAAGYPSVLEYVRVRANLAAHIQDLKTISEREWRKY